MAQPCISSAYLLDEAAVSDWSLSTNATAPNLPGSGRTLGLVYDYFGSKIEHFANKPGTGKAAVYGGQGFPAYLSSSESVNTNATTANLPGAGRTLGLAYELAGRVLESRLNQLAVKLGYGPDKAASRTRELRRKAILAHMSTADPRHVQSAEGYFNKRAGSTISDLLVEYVGSNASFWALGQVPLSPTKIRKLKQECKRLLKYADSDTISTQLQALDQMIDLMISVPAFREQFFALGAQSILQSVRLDATVGRTAESDLLLNRSRKALVALSENKMSTVLQNLSNAALAPTGELRSSLLLEQLTQMIGFLTDPDISFIVVRQLIRLLEEVYPLFLRSGKDGIVSKLAEFVTTCPDLVEWTIFEKFILVHLESVLFDSSFDLSDKYNMLRFGDSRHWALLLEFFFRNPDKFQGIISLADRSVQVIDNVGTLGLHRFPVFLWRVVDALVDFKALEDLELNVTDVQKLYSSPSLDRIWNALFFRPNLLLRQILCARLAVGFVPTEVDMVVDAKKVENICYHLVTLFISDDENVRKKALFYADIVRGLDRYCKSALLRVISKAQQDIRDPYLGTMLEQTYGDYNVTDVNAPVEHFPEQIYIYRHRDQFGDGGVHIRFYEPFVLCKHLPCEACDALYPGTSSPIDQDGATCDYDVSHILCTSADVLWLEVFPGSIFHAGDHYPVLAGVKTSGTKQYVARTRQLSKDPAKTQPYIEYICSVVDDASFVQYWDDDGVLRSSNHFFVLVLRFDPEVYADEMWITDSEAADSTGPLAWVPSTGKLAACRKCRVRR
ncbi:hypothetical protein M0805_005195 [Coniferiporia weirii]|nr:hypothetical protein M0805_005195 [Coniferiporia weirii]